MQKIKRNEKNGGKERLGNDFKEERRKLKDLVTLITKKKLPETINVFETHLLHLAAIDFQLSFR
jgi:hypothetical protein